jgi:hypothetical protein
MSLAESFKKNDRVVLQPSGATGVILEDSPADKVIVKVLVAGTILSINKTALTAATEPVAEPVKVYAAYYLYASVTVATEVGDVIGIVTKYSGPNDPMVEVRLDGVTNPTEFHKSNVKTRSLAYTATATKVEPKALFKDAQDTTGAEKFMADLFTIVSHGDLVSKAIEGIDLSGFDIIEEALYYVAVPKNIPEGTKVPMLIAHTDIHPTLTHPTAENLQYENKVFSGPTGLGADDRAGVFAISKLLQDPDTLGKFAFCFPDKEEVGCIGSRAFALSAKFKDIYPKISTFISIDRRREIGGGKTVALYGKNNDTLNKWVSELTGRKLVQGSTTDCRTLAEHSKSAVACFNLSCGYTAEHSSRETLHFDELLETLRDLNSILLDPRITADYPFKEVVTYRSPAVSKHYSQAYWDLEDESITLGGKIYAEEDLQTLLDVYTYYSGHTYAPKGKNNLVIPKLTPGTSLVRLATDMVPGQVYGGKVLSYDVFEGLKGAQWEVIKANKDNTYNLAIYDAPELTQTADNIPRRWLELIFKSDPSVNH